MHEKEDIHFQLWRKTVFIKPVAVLTAVGRNPLQKTFTISIAIRLCKIYKCKVCQIFFATHWRVTNTIERHANGRYSALVPSSMFVIQNSVHRIWRQTRLYFWSNVNKLSQHWSSYDVSNPKYFNCDITIERQIMKQPLSVFGKISGSLCKIFSKYFDFLCEYSSPRALSRITSSSSGSWFRLSVKTSVCQLKLPPFGFAKASTSMNRKGTSMDYEHEKSAIQTPSQCCSG